jgi:hypothetical protein
MDIKMDSEKNNEPSRRQEDLKDEDRMRLFLEIQARAKRAYEFRRRLTNATLVLSTLLSIALVTQRGIIITQILGIPDSDAIYAKLARDDANRSILIFGAVFLLISILTAFYQYLNNISIFSSELPPHIREQLKIEYSNSKYSATDPRDRPTASEVDSTQQNAQLQAQTFEFTDHYERTIQRISAEIEALDRRGNVNLIIGVGTTLSAVSILASTILFEPRTQDSFALLSHFAPRVTLSAFIELFSFFFLRLYSSGLQDIKYYQNELTNIELKFIALRRALELNDKASLIKLFMILAQTERNIILKKGETAIDLERYRQSQQNEKELFNAILGITKVHMPAK